MVTIMAMVMGDTPALTCHGKSEFAAALQIKIVVHLS